MLSNQLRDDCLILDNLLLFCSWWNQPVAFTWVEKRKFSLTLAFSSYFKNVSQIKWMLIKFCRNLPQYNHSESKHNCQCSMFPYGLAPVTIYMHLQIELIVAKSLHRIAASQHQCIPRLQFFCEIASHCEIIKGIALLVVTHLFTSS